ncbi:pacearchaeosortase [Candidatus Woesearchaeota archaeon]|nr:pacearchaeosortase [Candidatus Woesearchaeota archaeon]
MKYELSLIIRILTALIIRPDIFYFGLVFLTMFIPFIVLIILNYDVRFLYESKTLLVNGIDLEFVRACIATSAYYLLALLILTTKGIGIKNSVKMFLIGSLLIFVMNVLRVTLLILVVINLGLDWFNLIHMTFWYILSSVYVFLVWLFLIKLYKIKNIPIYSDAKYLIASLRVKKR